MRNEYSMALQMYLFFLQFEDNQLHVEALLLKAEKLASERADEVWQKISEAFSPSQFDIINSCKQYALVL